MQVAQHLLLELIFRQ